MEMKGRNQHKWELYQRAEASIIAVISYFSTIPVVVPAAVFLVGLLPSLYLSRAVHLVCLCEALFSATGHIQPHVSLPRDHIRHHQLQQREGKPLDTKQQQVGMGE